MLIKLIFSHVCLFRLWLVCTISKHTTVFRCLSTRTLPFFWWDEKQCTGSVTSVNTQPHAVISPISLWCQMWFLKLISAVWRVRALYAGRQWLVRKLDATNRLSQLLLTPKRCWPPTSYCCYLSSTFDHHQTDLTDITDAVLGSGRMFRSEFIVKCSLSVGRFSAAFRMLHLYTVS